MQEPAIIIRSGRPEPYTEPLRRNTSKPARPRLDRFRLRIARINDNELILFDHAQRESWIIYPPRSAYDFVRRPSPSAVIVEHRSWAPYTEIEEHSVLAAEGCTEHQLDCDAQVAIQAGIDAGWNPFR